MPTISQVVAAKRVVRAAAAKRAARKYTLVWDNIIKEASGIGTSTIHPPGFRGTQNQKYQRALLYKNRITNWAHRNPIKSPRVIYRGIFGKERNKFLQHDGVLNKTTLSSFTKDKRIAAEFAKTKAEYPVILLKLEGIKSIPGINFTSGKFQSEYAMGGKKYIKGRDEQEVLLPPGVFKRSGTHKTDKETNSLVYNVTYTPTKRNTSYLHTAPQRIVASRNKNGKYIYKDPTNSTYYKINNGGVRKSVIPPPINSNLIKKKSMGTNSKGCKIHVGPKGGAYVMSSAGKKLYTAVMRSIRGCYGTQVDSV